MRKIQFRENEFLKVNELKEGHVYLVKDGRVILYLGQQELAK